MLNSIPFPHEAEQIRLLQNGHANHIESIYRGLADIPGNPDKVILQKIGPTRTFIASGWRLENRAILTGNETFAEIDQVLEHFANHGANCVIEINPANFYRSQPFSWNAEVLPYLLSSGCEINYFRCVWQCTQSPEVNSNPDLRVYEPDAIEVYLDLAYQVEGPDRWDDVRRRCVRYGEAQPGWYHLVGYAGGQPCAVAGLYIQDGLGYLAWGYTHPDYRRQGFHAALIARRLELAFDLGCRYVFTVCDSYTQSARDLQRAGFQLAYNYLMLQREVEKSRNTP